MHIHCCVLDGVLEAAPDADGAVRFPEAVGLSAQAVAAAQAQVRRGVLRGFVRRGWLGEEAWRAMQSWAHGGGFAIDAEVRRRGSH